MQQNYYRTQNQCNFYLYDDEKQKKKTVTRTPFYFTRYKQRTGSMSLLPTKKMNLGEADFPGATASSIFSKKEPAKETSRQVDTRELGKVLNCIFNKVPHKNISSAVFNVSSPVK